MTSEGPKPVEPMEYREKLTSGRNSVVLLRKANPVKLLEVLEGGELFKLVSTSSPQLRPENYDKADGAPMTLFAGETVKVELSKRSVEDMGFWHRSTDYNEIILCLKGALHWETELGEATLHPGDLIWIPRGIAHRSMLCDESAEENVLIEVKVKEDLAYVADEGRGNG